MVTPAVQQQVVATVDEDPPASPPRRARSWLPFLIPLIAGIVGVWSLDQTNPGASTGYGLISALPILALLMIATVVASFVVFVARAPHREGLLYSHLLTAVILLYGAAPLAEHEGRLPTSYYVAGFVDQIASTGHVLSHADARWSWPGMFSSVAALLAPAGLHDALPLLLWAPVVLMVAYSLPLLAIGKALAPPRVRWVGVLLFYLADWTGQEYFSPQAVGLFFFLAILSITLTYLRRTDRRRLPLPPALHSRVGDKRSFGRAWKRPSASTPLGRLGAWLRSVDLTEPDTASIGRAQMLAVLGVWIAGVAALTLSHQITPVVLVLDLLGLAAVGRLLRNELAVLSLAMLLIYVSFRTTDFWAGHLGTLLGFSDAGNAISQNVGEHLTGNPTHGNVLTLRIGFTAAFWLLGFAGVVRLLYKRRLNLSVMVLGWLPFIIPVVQPYGGEALIRAFLLGLPFTAMMVAYAFLPSGRAGYKTWISLGLMLIILIPVFFVNRYGNEQFEATTPGEVAAVRFLYTHAPSGSALMVLEDDVPWKYTDLTRFNYTAVDYSGAIPTVSDVLKSVKSDQSKKTYLLLTSSQEDSVILNKGAPNGWLDALSTKLIATGDFRVVLRNDNALVLEYQGA